MPSVTTLSADHAHANQYGVFADDVRERSEMSSIFVASGNMPEKIPDRRNTQLPKGSGATRSHRPEAAQRCIHRGRHTGRRRCAGTAGTRLVVV